MYVEACKNVMDIKERGNLVPFSSIVPEARGHEYYISLFPFDKTITDYVKINKSIKGHTGKHFCWYILVDLDSDDLNSARAEAVKLINKLQSDYSLSPDDLYIYFSGAKGFHVVLWHMVFGTLEPHEEMGSLIKLAVNEIAQGIKYDPKIYENHRLIRVENSLNAKTDLYKIQLSYKEITELSIDEIKQLAKRPRTFMRSKATSDIKVNDKIKRVVNSVFLKQDNQTIAKQIDDGFFMPARSGDRNNQLYKQAFFLFKNTDLHEKSIREIVTSINNSAPDPLPISEVHTIINSARTHRKDKKEKEALKISTFADMWQTYMDSLNEENNKIKLTFKSLDELFKGKQRGKLGIVLGYGGAKKSLYGQNVCLDNIKSLNRCVYSNMEMGTATLTERFINIALDAPTGLATQFFEEKLKTNSEVANKLLQTMKGILSEYLLVSENSNMTCDRYDELIDKITNEHGRVDVLIVDGMSMMGGSGTEVERANEHSKGLKELAKKWDILVIAICHVSKGDDLLTKDLTRKARGSEKIVDNADWIMTLSLIKQGALYVEKAGFYHLWDKRGTGKRIEKIWIFDENSLSMSETDKSEAELGYEKHNEEQ